MYMGKKKDMFGLGFIYKEVFTETMPVSREIGIWGTLPPLSELPIWAILRNAMAAIEVILSQCKTETRSVWAVTTIRTRPHIAYQTRSTKINQYYLTTNRTTLSPPPYSCIENCKHPTGLVFMMAITNNGTTHTTKHSHSLLSILQTIGHLASFSCSPDKVHRPVVYQQSIFPSQSFWWTSIHWAGHTPTHIIAGRACVFWHQAPPPHSSLP